MYARVQVSHGLKERSPLLRSGVRITLELCYELDLLSGLRAAQFCTVTGSAYESIEPCQILNTVRKRREESAEEAQARKVAVVRILQYFFVLFIDPVYRRNS
jgi:hypothetical protein